MYSSVHIEAKQASPLRQRASRLVGERQALEKVLMGRGPMLRGSLLERPRLCGKKGCKCARGEPHPSGLYISRPVEGTARHRFIRSADHQRARKEALAYKEFRQALRRWRAIVKELNEIWEALGEAREEDYPFE
ncbi:MAG: hypothetical protein Q8N45_07640 [Anaerolineales bacterium]|nr:hypothetical protein [Anaerolineales bacterium]